MSRHGLNAMLDRLVRPEVQVLRRRRSAFHVCGSTGLALGAGTGVFLTLYQNLPIRVLVATVLVAVTTFLVLAMVTKVVLREEQLVYYHHEIAILCTVTLLLTLLGEPVLPHLDVTILGIGAFLFCGRVGCFMVGCCHGRPCRWGVRYRPEHADAGFTPYYVGVRLLPIQLVESCWVLTTVVTGVGLVLGGAPPGTALAWYVIVYDIGRFCFEFVRGDPARPCRAGFSEGQWTSLLLMVVVVVAELTGALPPHTWHLAATAGVLLVMVAVIVHRDTRHRLLNPDHIAELASALERLSAPGHEGTASVEVLTTSEGLRLSTGPAPTPTGELRHYTMSMVDGRLDEVGAHAVAATINLLRGHDHPGELLAGIEGVFHLVTRSPSSPDHRKVMTP